MIKLAAVGVALVSVVLALQTDQWSATLKPSGGSAVSGIATAARIGSADSTLVKISIRGARPNASLLWHVRGGSCAAPGAVFGSDSAYSGIQANGAGTAEASVTLPLRPVPTGSYAVTVHRVAAAPSGPWGAVVACGDLRVVLNKRPPV